MSTNVQYHQSSERDTPTRTNPRTIKSRALAPGTPAPYGRACLGCVQGKCKCITRIDGGCERCHRMRRECRRAVPTRRKNAAASSTVLLEEKLDSIVSLLRSGASPGSVATQSNMLWDSSGSDDYTLATSTSSHNEHETSPNSPQESLASSSVSDPSPDEAEEYLYIFRTQKAKYLPFLYLPATGSSSELQKERPFLWLCIMAVSAKSTAQQTSLNNKVRLILSNKMLLDLENNIDLLLGLLTFVGWSNCHVQRKKSLSVFTQMAMSLVFDLGLNKPAGETSHEMSNLYAYGCPEPSKSKARTMEERRAVLGCFLVSSIISSFLQRMDALRWTPHMDECLEALALQEECPTDHALVQQVRLQLIVEKAARIPLHSGEVKDTESLRIPAALYAKALQSQIQAVRDKVLPESPLSEVELLHLHSTTLTVNEVEFSKLPTLSNCSDFYRLEALYVSLNAVKSWFDIFFSIPTTAYVGFPFSIFSQLIHCLISLFKLSTLEDPAWDKGIVRETADVHSILNQIILNMQEANDWYNAESEVFTKAAEALGTIRSRWRVKLGLPIIPPGYLPGLMANGEEVMGQHSVAMEDVMSMELPEEWWFSDVFASMDC